MGKILFALILVMSGISAVEAAPDFTITVSSEANIHLLEQALIEGEVNFTRDGEIITTNKPIDQLFEKFASTVYAEQPSRMALEKQCQGEGMYNFFRNFHPNVFLLADPRNYRPFVVYWDEPRTASSEGLFMNSAVALTGDCDSQEPIDNGARPELVETYIPTDLEDCFSALDNLLTIEEIESLRKSTESGLSRYHMGLGKWLRNNWGLWQGSRLVDWFNSEGVWHADDMSAIIIESYWRYLNEKPSNFDAEVQRYQEYWESAREEVDGGT